MPKKPPERDVTWGDNVIYANFSAGAERGRLDKPHSSTAAAVGISAQSEAIAKLADKAEWELVSSHTRSRRVARRSFQPRTTFSQWFWEFTCKNADEGRRTRGEQYFRDDKVIGLRIGDGFIAGEVQGSQIEPFSVYIRLPHRDITHIDEILQWLVDNPRYIDGFENGELPFDQMAKLICDIDENFVADCTCPDPAHTCKHIVAVGAQYAQQTDDDPMTMLELRGLQPRDIQRRMRQLVDLKSQTEQRPAGILRRRQHRAGQPGQPGEPGQPGAPGQPGQPGAPGQLSTGNPEQSDVSLTPEIHAVAEDFWGYDLPRIQVPKLTPIDPLKVTDQSLLHEALLPTCIISRETLRAVSDLEDCWNHMKTALSLNQREKLW